MFSIFLVILFTLLVAAAFVHDAVRLKRMPLLDQLAPPPPSPPLVTLLIPARNEARNIARCLDGALRQTYPNYNVVVVDDNSTDATPAILADYARRDGRVQVVHGTPLPPGWLGKCHACQQAANVAEGEWLLFLDADTAPQPTLVAALLNHALGHRLDALTIFPFLELGSFWERLIMPPFLGLITASFPYERLSAPDVRPDEVVANGQCILVRRAAYESIGGHGAVRNEVLEDVQLGQRLRAAGHTIGAATGMEQLHVRMYVNGAEVVAGLTKNAAAGYRSAGGRSFWAMTRLLLQAMGPLWLLGVGLLLVLSEGSNLAWAVLAHGTVLAAIAFSFWAMLVRRLYRLPWFYGLLWPCGLLVYCLIAARSLWLVWSGRGVVWKGRSYAGK